MIEQRKPGRGWEELAEELKTHPDTLRKRVARAIERAARELGLDGSDA